MTRTEREMSSLTAKLRKYNSSSIYFMLLPQEVSILGPYSPPPYIFALGGRLLFSCQLGIPAFATMRNKIKIGTTSHYPHLTVPVALCVLFIEYPNRILAFCNAE